MPAEIPDLIAALDSADANVRASAVEHLAQLGPDAQDAAAALVRACGDAAEDVC